MSRILVVSDTHGNNKILADVIKKERPFDMLVHCGDAECSEGSLRALADTPVYVCEGNNDYFYDLSRRIVFDVAGHRVLLTHGHYDKVYYDLDTLNYRAKEAGADIVMFGHTHVPCVRNIDGIRFVNPGSLTYPRQTGRQPTYIIMDIDADNIQIDLKNYSVLQ